MQLAQTSRGAPCAVGRRARQLGEQPFGEGIDVDPRARAQDDGVVHGVPQLAHVPRPWVIEQQPLCRRRERRRRDALGARERRDERRRERKDVLAPLPEGRDVDLDHVEPGVEIPPEPSGAHPSREVVLRGSHHAHVRDLASPREEAEDGSLQRLRQRGDLLEEDRAAVRRRHRLEQLPVGGGCAGEGQTVHGHEATTAAG